MNLQLDQDLLDVKSVTTEDGVNWWYHKSITDYAMSKSLNVTGWIVETSNGVKEFVLIENDEVIYSSQQLEAIAIRLDMMAFDKKF